MNNNIIPSDSRYIPLTQQRWLCVPTCIQMLMLKHNIPLVPAELMGHHMKLIVPKEDIFLFWNKNIKTGEKPKAGYGTQLTIGNGLSINDVLNKLKIPLRMKRKLINQFENFKEFEKYFENFDYNKDVLACYDWGTLFDKDLRQGHVCVLDKTDLDKNEVRIIDPSAIAPKWRIVKMVKLFQSMKIHGKDNGAGFWEFSSIN
jgi:hypothetical protein